MRSHARAREFVVTDYAALSAWRARHGITEPFTDGPEAPGRDYERRKADSVPPIPAIGPATYCGACARSGVGACDDFPNCPAGGVMRKSDAVQLSAKETDYLSTLPEQLRVSAAKELVEYQPERMEDFINYLRLSEGGIRR